MTNVIKDGLHGIKEIKGGIGSYHKDGTLNEFVQMKVAEQERKLLGRARGEESFDRQTLEALAAALGEATVKRTGLALAPVDSAAPIPPRNAQGQQPAPLPPR